MLNNLINMKKKTRKSSKLPFFIKNNAVSQQYDRLKKKRISNVTSRKN